MNKQTVFLFPNYAPDIFADINGDFFDLQTQRLLKKKYYNGRICIQNKNKRYGIKKLRKYIQKKTIEINNLPF